MKKGLFLIQILATAISLYAVDIQTYGEINIGIWLEQRERWYDDTIGVDTMGDTTIEMGKDSLPIFFNSWIPSGKLGFKIKGDKWSGCMEFGISSNIYDANLSGITGLRLLRRENESLYMRKWYTEWYFNDFFSILIGQDNLPLNFVSQCNQAYYDWNSLCNLGCTYTGRRPMLQATIGGEIAPSFNLKGKIAFIRTDTTVIAFRGNLQEAEVETRFPKMEGSVEVNLEKDIFGITAKVAGGFQQQYSLLRNDPTLLVEDFRAPVPCFGVGGELGAKIGPVHIGGTFLTSQNPAVYGIAAGNRWEWASGNPTDPRTVNVFYPYFERVTDSITNEDTYKRRDSKMTQFAAILGLKPIEALGFEGGFAFQTVDHDFKDFIAMWDDRMAWYFQIDIRVFGNQLRLIPEVGQFLWGDEYMKGGRHTYGGVMTSVQF